VIKKTYIENNLLFETHGKTVISASRGLLIIWRWEKEKETSTQQHIFNCHILAIQTERPCG
jgi:hypothetical protein